MFRLGFTEILLFLLIFFLIDPRGFPKLFRRVGKLVGKIKSMQNELNKTIGVDNTNNKRHSGDKQEDHPKGEQTRKEQESPENIFQRDSMENVRLLMLDMLQKDYDYTATESVLKMLFDTSAKVRDKASKVLWMDPVFSFEKRNIRRNAIIPKSVDCRNPLEAIFSAEKINRYSEIIKKVPEKYFKPCVSYLAEYPGIENLDINGIFSGTKKQFYDLFKSEHKKILARKYPRQLTVSPSYKCNLDCPYCFQDDIRKSFPADMSLQEFKDILDKSESDPPVTRISIFGGEPTFFNGLTTFIDEIERRELYFYFATNGIAEPEKFTEILNRPSLETVTFHIERDNFYTEQQKKNLMRNMENASRKKMLIILRYNLQDPDNEDWSFLNTYEKILPRVNLTFSVVFPSMSRSNSYVDLCKLKDFRSKILSLISYFADRPFPGNYTLAFAKPYPLCFFSQEELYYVLKHTIVKNICEIDKNGSTNNLLVNPDGTYSPCMAMMSDNFRFPPYSSIDDLSGLYYSRVRDLQKVPMMEECKSCSLHHRGLCQAACYAYQN